MNTQTLTQEQILKLKKSCENLFKEGTPSLRFMRTLHNDYQYYCNDDLNSYDDFYNMNHESNKEMKDLLNFLGYNYTPYGITLF